MNQLPPAFWCVSATEILQRLETPKEGLSSEEARQRLARYGSNLLEPQKRSDVLTLLLAQFKSPLILLLLFATGLSFFLHDPVNALIILTIVLVSGLLGFWQEHSATNAVEQLLAMVQIKATVLRDGSPHETPSRKRYSGWMYSYHSSSFIRPLLKEAILSDAKVLLTCTWRLTG